MCVCVVDQRTALNVWHYASQRLWKMDLQIHPYRKHRSHFCGQAAVGAVWHARRGINNPPASRKECYYCILHSSRQQGVSPIFPCNMCEIRSCHQAFLSAPRQLSSSSPVSVSDSLPTPTTAPLQEKIAAIRQIASDVVSPHQNPVFHCQIVQPVLYLWLCLTVKSPK